MRLFGTCVSLAVLAAVPAQVLAQSASTQAQSLFDEGRRLLAAGKVGEACASFDSSQKLDPAITTLLNLAECREQNHQLATAWGAFTDAQRMARTAGNDKLVKVASTHAKKLEPKLSKLTISVPTDHQVPGLEVLRGSDSINAAAWNHALPIDGGTYTISARAPGFAPWSVSKTVKNESDQVTVEVPRLTEVKPVAATTPSGPPGASGPGGQNISTGGRGDVPEVKPADSVATTAPAIVPAQPADTADAPRGHSAVVPLVLGGAAVALAGGALAFDLAGNREYDRAKAATVQSERDSAVSSANTRRYAAEGLGVAAIGCAGAAVYLFVRGRGDHRTETAVAPITGPQFTGFAVTGSW